MNKTGISYTDFTWNPTHGCSSYSTGCRSCWAEAISKRLAAMGVKGYDPDDPFKVVCMPDKLSEPLNRKKPAIIAVSFMGDLYHPDVPVEFIDRVVGVMALATQHRFIILTKRAERMHDYFTGLRDDPKQAWRFDQQMKIAPERFHKAAMTFRKGRSLPNVIGMVTVEDQETADARIPWLLKTPFAMRGVSAEPLLSELDLTQIKVPDNECQLTTYGYLEYHFNALDMMDEDQFHNPPSKLDWVVAGGESGHGARPMHPNWARKLRDDCKEIGVPFYFKQHGAYIQCETSQDVFNHETKCFETIPAGLAFKRVGKKKAGHLLDGEEWHQMPEGMKIG